MCASPPQRYTVSEVGQEPCAEVQPREACELQHAQPFILLSDNIPPVCHYPRPCLSERCGEVASRSPISALRGLPVHLLDADSPLSMILPQALHLPSILATWAACRSDGGRGRRHSRPYSLSTRASRRTPFFVDLCVRVPLAPVPEVGDGGRQ